MVFIQLKCVTYNIVQTRMIKTTEIFLNCIKSDVYSEINTFIKKFNAFVNGIIFLFSAGGTNIKTYISVFYYTTRHRHECGRGEEIKQKNKM